MSETWTAERRTAASSAGRAGVRADVTDRTWRRATVVISVVAHVAAGLSAVAYSFWHIEEVSPPRVTLTFIAAASIPLPPPPLPPLASSSASAPKHRSAPRVKTDTVPVVARDNPTPTPVAETPVKIPVAELPHEAPAGDPHAKTGAGDGTGTGEGVGKGPKGPGLPCNGPNCSAAGIVGAPAGPPKFLPPQMGAQLKLSGAEPDFPAFLRHAGTSYLIMAKICVSASGAVDSVTLQKRAEPTLDTNVTSAVKAWRFRPMTANGTPVPFCYFGRFEFKSD